MTTVLAIVAHPDDEVLGVGGTLLRHKRLGHEVSVVMLYDCAVRPIETQRAQADESSRRLGIPIDGVRDLDAHVADLRPDVVYTHSAADLHHEHLDTLYRAMVACRPQSGVRGLYAFETPSATDWSGRDFGPRLFVDISETIEPKLWALGAYESELRDLPHPRDPDGLRQRAGYWGQRAGLDAAEAFEVLRECW
jgi:LmbE family N-acetylglucosaminyl deacetylase